MSAQPVSDDMPQAPQTPMQLEGYQNLGFVTVPSQTFDLKSNPDEQRPGFQNVPYLSEDEAKTALANFVSEHCCYGKGPVKELVFNNLQSSNTYRYLLQTYTETRSTAYATEPYSGAPIYISGQPSPPWSINVQPQILFNNEIVKLEIPNTAHVENCSSCMGIGTKVCFDCNGIGTKSCWMCHGSGHSSIGASNLSYDSFNHDHHHHHHDDHHHHHQYDDHHDHHHHNEGHTLCSHCDGAGFNICITCHRLGKVQCRTCVGSGKLKWFLQLTVNFQNNEEDFLKKSDTIPDDLIRTCQAQTTFSEQNVRLYPITHHLDSDVNQASYNLLNSHSSKFSNSRIVAQRHELFVIPVTLCKYSWKNQDYKFHVYGLDQRVYSPDYPKKCCCTIL